MNITIEPLPTPITTDQRILADNIQLGVIKKAEPGTNCAHHVILNSKYPFSMYQGFGNTIDEALRSAITVNRERRHKELAELDELENVIWGDHEIDKQ